MVEHCQFLRVGELAAIVGDDTARGPGTGEYSGLWSLVHDSCPAGAFQAAYAGLIASAHRGTGPTLERLDENAARLVRGPCDRNPHATVSGTYRLAAPHYVDYTYDVEFTAPRFNDGKKVKNARITTRHNGILIHDDFELDKGTGAGGGRPEKEKGQIHLQGHGNPVRFQNIWLGER